MGNEQSAEGQALPETGLRLSTLCRYQAESGNEEGVSFSWFQASTDVSGLALKGAHRWGYVQSYFGGQRLFKDQRQRFFVLLDHYMCYFDSHAPEARMKGSIDLDKTHCDLELLPRPPETVDILLQSSGGGENDEHCVEVTRRNGDFSIVLCFSTATSLSEWMMTIFDVQQRKATFSPLGHGGRSGGGEDDDDDSDGDDDDDNSECSSGPPTLMPGSSDRTSFRGSVSSGGEVSSAISQDNAQTQSLRVSGRRRRGRLRGTVDSPPLLASPPSPIPRGGSGVPSSWAEDDVDVTTPERGGGGGGGGGDTTRDRGPRVDEIRPSSSGQAPRRISSSTSSVWLAKASERLKGLPRGGRAAGNSCSVGDGDGGNMDEYGAFTTAQASIYEGWTRGLQPHGWGRMIFANGDCFEGWWEHDVLQGSGEHTSREEGWTYRGGYVSGERHGPGRLMTAQGDVWECEWSHGFVSHGSRGTHAAAGGELYHGGCAPCAGDPSMPCRAGQGRLRRRNGEQVDTKFRAGKAVDGAKGVVRFGNGAIFFGELQEARPHGYGELYLSSVNPAGYRASRGGSSGNSSKSNAGCAGRRRRYNRSLAELDEMARDILWYKGDFRLGKPHGSGLVKFKEPSRGQGRGDLRREGGTGVPAGVRGWDESKEEGEEQREAKGDSVEDGEDYEDRSSEEDEDEDEDERGVPMPLPFALAVRATDEAIILDGYDEEDDSTSDSDDDGEDEEEERGGRGEQREEEEEEEGRRRCNAGGRRAVLQGGEGGLMRSAKRERPVKSGGSPTDSGGGGADMEYEADFVEGVMVRHDSSHLRLAALRFGRAEIRRLETLLQKEEDAMSRLRVRGLCLLCNSEEMNALLVGCRHRVLCMGCAGRTDRCPVCNERIGKVVKTYRT